LTSEIAYITSSAARVFWKTYVGRAGATDCQGRRDPLPVQGGIGSAGAVSCTRSTPIVTH